ncbi:MAG: MTAP family purine nucleoside phosphorylase [Methanomicrobiales archaeon]|nr:MTAP family purine nucleoside phosphorylase [Methanomicrobiales archaeon]MDD1669789.1 MTAP family purine nucleoside phosphorylase [Methanomicrobiales archaeon]
MLGILGGTSLLFSRLPDLEARRIDTPYGPAEVLCGDFALLRRHQRGLPPHRINFRANLAAFAILGVDRIVAIGSAGSLKREIPPGSLAIPRDFLTWGESPSIHDHAIGHVLPALDPDLSASLGRIVPGAHTGGIYAQTGGPRIETVAEVQALARVADLVGMTLASEATLACELGMPFSALCTVDNYAHGLGGEPPTWEHILEASRAHRDRTGSIMEKIVEVMG